MRSVAAVDGCPVVPCALPHPGWDGAHDDAQPSRLECTWQVSAGTRPGAHRVDHGQPRLAEYATLPAGASLRYLGSSYRHGFPPYDFGYHVFQVLDAGPSTSAWPAHVGECYEIETWDDAEAAALWRSLEARR